MIAYISIFSNILVIAFWLAKVLKQKISLTFSLALIFIMIILYISGLAGNLIIGDITLKVLACGFLCDLFLTRKSYKLKDLTDNSIFLLIIFYIVSIYLLKDNIHLQHNEIGHWALGVKNFYINNSIHITNDLHVGYMPSVGLLGYWFLRFFKSFSDNMIYIVNSFFTYSIVISICYQIKTKQKFFISIITIFLLPLVSNLIFNFLYIEPILALVFVLGLIFLINNEKNLKNSIILFFIIAGLSIIKKVSILFVLTLFLPVLFDKNETLINKIKFILPSVMACVLINFAWKDFLILNNLCQARDIFGLNFQNMINFVTGKGEPYQYSVIPNMFNALIGVNYSVIKFSTYKIPSIYFFLGSVIYMIISSVVVKEYKLRQFVSTIIIFNLLYLLSLIVMYLFGFAPWEAAYLSGFKRYFQVINIINLLGVIYIYFSYDLIKIKQMTNYRVLKFIFPLLIILISNSWYMQSYTHNKYEIMLPQKLTEQVELNDKDKILLITKHIKDLNTNREMLLFKHRYQNVPFKIFIMNKTLVTKEEIENKLSCNYTYIYFDDCDKDVLELYQFLSLQPIINNHLYKLIKTKEDKFIIKY